MFLRVSSLTSTIVQIIFTFELRLCHSENVQQIFWDECHQLLIDCIYQNKWTAVQALILDTSWQLIHLTATLPVNLQDIWAQLAGINKARTIFLHGPANHLKLAYNVLHVNPKEWDLESVIKHLVHMLENDSKHKDAHCIIFVACKALCDELADMLGCFKHNHLEGWKSGVMVGFDTTSWRETWIIATPGLILGYDYHLVVDVIFYEIGYGLLNLVQGGGRGGQSGKKANVILLTSDRVQTSHQGLDPSEDLELLGLMTQRAHNTKLCRRWIISDAMDGQPITCTELAGAQLCDICQPDSQLTQLLYKAVELAQKPRSAIMPIQDIQLLLASTTQNIQHVDSGSSQNRPSYSDNIDNMDFKDDSLILNLDLMTVNMANPTTQSLIHHTVNWVIAPSISRSIPIYQPHHSIQTSKLFGTPLHAVHIKQPTVLKHMQTLGSLPSIHDTHTMSSTAIAAVSDVGMNVRVSASGNQLMQQTKNSNTQQYGLNPSWTLCCMLDLEGHLHKDYSRSTTSAICRLWQGKLL
jgi:superfamily II DNA helicase RecQ